MVHLAMVFFQPSTLPCLIVFGSKKRAVAPRLKFPAFSYPRPGPLGKKLRERELDSGFEARFGGKKLSEWLSDLSDLVEINAQMVRIADSEIPERIILLREAYLQVRRSNGMAHIGQIGQILRKLDAGFESHFGKKKLSEWLDEYPYIFKRHENYVALL
jgi:hypothetical protein